MNTNQSPERRYIVSLILASFWGFLGLKEAYNRKWPLAIIRFVTALTALVLFLVSLVTPIIVANVAIILLALWVIIDVLGTFRAKASPLKEQKQAATEADLSIAKYVVAMSLVLSLFVIVWMALPAYNHLNRQVHVTNAQERARELIEPFSELEYGMTRAEVADIMGQYDNCTQEFRGVGIVNGTLVGNSYRITCTHGQSLSDGISTAGPDENYQSYTIQLRFVRYELFPAFVEQFGDVAPPEFILEQKEFIQRFY